ncbi:MAG TPA: class I tRNA ligase family protein [Candidatus Limnocylindria bacterium]|nr:class I tRNA ligase family protein [Candidatus Limnocylindria bacterium]
MLRLYDTRRRVVVPFRTLSSPITLYVCGVTPYDTTHLGHARTFLVFDVLVRHLEAAGRAVRYAQNVTDIDESILQRAARDRVSWRELGRREERAFLADMRRLGWRRPDVMPHATREIASMRQMTDVLVGKECAYDIDGGVYFDTTRDRHYGELSRYSEARMRRIIASQDDAALDDPQRRHPADFALWRRVPSGPTWPSRHGRGRPGWHIECSAMSLRHLGPRIDIHGGGSDLIYPHHENEIAQSECATGKRPFVGWWMHTGPVLLKAEKMSKSRGNMVFVRTALETVTPQALRLYLLDRHYRLSFDHDEARLVRAGERASTLADALGRGAVGPLGRDAATREVLAALDDDLDTRTAIRALERGARRASAGVKRSLRHVARRVLGIL